MWARSGWSSGDSPPEQRNRSRDDVQRRSQLVTEIGDHAAEAILLAAPRQRLGCDLPFPLQGSLDRTPCREVSRDFREPDQSPLRIPQRSEGDIRPEGRSITANPVSLPVVLARLRGRLEMRLGCAVFGAAIGVQQPQVRAFGLVPRPPLHQPCALAPAPDDPIRVHEKDGVVANVLSDQRVQQPGFQVPDVWRTQRLRGLARARRATAESGVTLLLLSPAPAGLILSEGHGSTGCVRIGRRLVGWRHVGVHHSGRRMRSRAPVDFTPDDWRTSAGGPGRSTEPNGRVHGSSPRLDAA